MPIDADLEALFGPPAVAAPKIGKLNFTDQSTRPDGLVKAERDATPAPAPAVQTATVAAVLPPDAPPNDPNAAPPEKAKRTRRTKEQIAADDAQIAKDLAVIRAKNAATVESALVPGASGVPTGVVTSEPTQPDPHVWVSRIELGPETLAVLRDLIAALQA